MVCVYVCVFGYICVTTHVWKSEYNLQEELLLLFHHVGSCVLIQVVSHGNKHLIS